MGWSDSALQASGTFSSPVTPSIRKWIGTGRSFKVMRCILRLKGSKRLHQEQLNGLHFENMPLKNINDQPFPNFSQVLRTCFSLDASAGPTSDQQWDTRTIHFNCVSHGLVGRSAWKMQCLEPTRCHPYSACFLLHARLHKGSRDWWGKWWSIGGFDATGIWEKNTSSMPMKPTNDCG